MIRRAGVRLAVLLGLFALACLTGLAPAALPRPLDASATPASATPASATPPAGGPTTTGAPISSGLSPNPSGASLRLTSQTPWVSLATSGNVFDLNVLPGVPASVGDPQVNVEVYDLLDNRSQFARSLTTAFAGYVIGHPIRAPLSSFARGADGAIDVKITVGPKVGQLHLYQPGVYPVSVDLRPPGGGPPLAKLVTYLVFASGPATAHKLNVVWVLPVHAPPADPTTGKIDAAQERSVATVIGALAAHPGVAVTVVPTPDTVAALETADPATVNRLGQSVTSGEVLGGTWVPTDVPAMLVDNLASQVSLSLTAGDDALTADLGTSVDGESWVVNGPVDQNTLSFLRGSQFDRVVLPETDLDPNPLPKTLAQPFEVAGTDETLIRAAVADAGLAAHFTEQPDPVLAAHQLLADLAQIYEDAPNATDARGVVVVTPPGWPPSGAFVNALLDGLSTSPIIAAQTLDQFFDAVPPASDPRDGGPLIRQVVTDSASIQRDAVALLAPDQLKARRQLDALATTLPEDTAVYPRLERLLLQVPSTDLSVAGRQGRLNDFATGLRAEAALIQLPPSRTITLTARKGQLPINVTSLSDEPLRVRLEVQSDKLQVPGRPATGPVTFAITLHKGNNLTVLTVEARTSGAFPLRIAVLSNDGSLVLTKTSFTVQSTALSGVGVVLSVGAAVFLVVWWARHAWRAKRGAHGARRRHARHRGVQPGTGLAT